MGPLLLYNRCRTLVHTRASLRESVVGAQVALQLQRGVNLIAMRRHRLNKRRCAHWSLVLRVVPRYAPRRILTRARPGLRRILLAMGGTLVQSFPAPPLGVAKTVAATSTNTTPTTPSCWTQLRRPPYRRPLPLPGYLLVRRRVRARLLTALLVCLHVAVCYVAGCLWPI